MSEFEVRDPIHKRIPFNAFERRVIDHRLVQRLRFISQLSFLQSYVYPGATHDRFSHALGAMHVAGRLIGQMRSSVGPDGLGIDEGSWKELAQVMRLAGLLHDIGHGPFSHSSEEVFPTLNDLPLENRWWKGGARPRRQARHEDYSVLFIQVLAEEHVLSETMAQDIASLVHAEIEPSPWFEDLEFLAPGLHQACKSLISGEIDCDRMDYLLRDSHYCGVTYGQYDLDWLITSLAFSVREGRVVLSISENGVRAFEDMLLARYHMIDQVYYHKTKAGFAHYLIEAFRQHEIDLKIPGEPLAYADLRDGRVIELLITASRQGKYWSKHLMERLPAKHVQRLYLSRDRDRAQLASLVELCRREGIGFFVHESLNVMSRIDMQAEEGDFFVRRKTVTGHELVPIQDYSDLLQKYNEKLRFADFYVRREDAERFERVVRL